MLTCPEYWIFLDVTCSILGLLNYRIEICFYWSNLRKLIEVSKAQFLELCMIMCLKTFGTLLELCVIMCLKTFLVTLLELWRRQELNLKTLCHVPDSITIYVFFFSFPDDVIFI